MKRGDSHFESDIKIKILPNSKCSQVTIFIILGIVVIVVLAVFVFFISNQSSLDDEFFESVAIKPKLNQVQNGIFGCVEDLSQEALVYVGLRGGYFLEPVDREYYFDGEDSFIPYYYNLGDYSTPTLVNIEKELEDYVNSNYKECLGSVNVDDFGLEYDKIDTNVKISKSNVDFLIDSSIKIEKGNKYTFLELEKYPLTINSSLFDIVDLAKYITDSHEDDPEFFCISCVGELAEEKDVYVTQDILEENIILFIIYENRTSSEQYNFRFVNKYSGDEKSPVTSSGVLPPAPA